MPILAQGLFCSFSLFFLFVSLSGSSLRFSLGFCCVFFCSLSCDPMAEGEARPDLRFGEGEVAALVGNAARDALGGGLGIAETPPRPSARPGAGAPRGPATPFGASDLEVSSDKAPEGRDLFDLIHDQGSVEFNRLTHDSFMQWAILKGINDGPQFPVSRVIYRLVSLAIWNPGFLCTYDLACLLVHWGSDASSLEPDLTTNAEALHIVRRLHQRAREDDASALLPQVHPAGGAPGRPQGTIDFSKDVQLMAQSMQKLSQGLSTALRKPDRDGLKSDVNSDDEYDSSVDLPAWLRRKELRGLTAQWFLPLKKLNKLNSLYVKAQLRYPSARSCFLADGYLEDFIPPWVGMDLHRNEQEALTRSWRNDLRDGRNSSRCICFLKCFWLSHAAVGICDLSVVYVHESLLLQLAADHTLTFMLKYHRRLQAKILSHVKEDGSRSINSFLYELNDSIVTELEIKEPRPRDQALRDRPPRETPEARKRRLDDKRSSEDTPPPKRPRVVAPINLQPRVKAPAAKTSARPTSTTSESICFFHHPAQGKSCTRQGCKFTHLDTAQPQFLKRYESALSNYKGSARPQE